MIRSPAVAARVGTSRFSSGSGGLADSLAKRAQQRDGNDDASRAELIKLIRKPVSLFEKLVEGVNNDLRAIPKIEGDKALQGLLTANERHDYMKSVMTNVGFSYPVAKNFDKSAFGLPLMGSAIYSHMFAGLGNYCAEKTGRSAQDSLRVATYYRTPVMVEELKRLGYSEKDCFDIVAKQFYMQYWSGQSGGADPLLFNPLVRSFYPTTSHISSGSTDLGRETELQAARLYCMGQEGMKAPVTVINTGDTGMFTDGAMHALQHIVEAQERGFAMPLIFLINANNSAISARIDYGDHYGDEGAFGIARIQKRFKMFGGLINEGFTTKAEDVAGGVQSMRNAVDQVLETGKPTYVMSTFPFRPGGHASDNSPASDQMLLDQFERFKNTLVSQICASADTGASGNEIADIFATVRSEIEGSVTHAITGNKVLTRNEIVELSVPGTNALAKEAGRMIEIPANYLLGKGQKEFRGMGADIFGKALNRTFDTCDTEGRTARYVHQENHHQNKTDTRGGVYGELNLIEKQHLDKFVGFMPQEAQVVQVGMGFRSVLPENNLVFVKGPHTVFNEHARDHMKYAAFRHADSGTHANHIYLFDGGSLAFKDKAKVINEAGEEVDRELWLARVGEHHNTPAYDCFNCTNTTMAVPMDMNVFDACLPEMIKLHDYGRMVLGVVPTASFGLLHAAMKIPAGLTQNDILKVDIPGKVEPLNGKKLVIVGWGPDMKMVAKTLVDHNLKSEMLILNYMEAPNALISFLDDLAQRGIGTEVICVDPNMNAAFLGPVMAKVKKTLGYPQDLIFTDCTIEDAFVPYGLGEGLLNSTDLVSVLKQRGVLTGADSVAKKVVREAAAEPTKAAPKVKEAAAVPKKSSLPEGHKEIVYAPIEGDVVVTKVHKKVGDAVAVDDLIAELESDKATIEITSPIDGVLEELFLKDEQSLTLAPDVKMCTVAAVSSKSVATKIEYDAAKAVGVNSPLACAKATIVYLKNVGEKVNAGEVVAILESPQIAGEHAMADGKVEIETPNTGTLVETFMDDGPCANLTNDTRIFSIIPADSTQTMPSMDMEIFGSSMWLPDSIDSMQKLSPAMQAKALEVINKKQVVEESEKVVPLSRHHLAMVDNMTIKAGDTRTFVVSERVSFRKVVQASKKESVTPVVTLVKSLADSLAKLEMNVKLTEDRKGKRSIRQIDIGVAVDVEGQLRVAVCRDVASKTLQEVRDDIVTFANKGAKLSVQDQNLDSVCWVVSSMGKDASDSVVAVLPKDCAGILAVGRMDEQGKSAFAATICHATLSGIEGAKVVRALAEKLEA